MKEDSKSPVTGSAHKHAAGSGWRRHTRSKRTRER